MNYQKIQIQKIFLKDNAKIVILENADYQVIMIHVINMLQTIQNRPDNKFNISGHSWSAVDSL